MDWLWLGFWGIWLIGLALIVSYGWVILFGAPYIPTLKRQRHQAIELLALKPGQTFIDLGCGDGSLLILAAQRGWRAIGYELNPILVLVVWLRTRRYRHLVKLKWG